MQMTGKKNMREEAEAIDDELLAVIAQIKGEAVKNAEPQPVSKLYPFSEKINAAERAEEARLKAEAEIMAKAAPGQLIQGHGVFVGKHTVETDGGLRRIFNVFAAPEDLPGEKNYYDT